MDRYKQAKKVSIISFLTNLFLFIIKIIFALISNSQGLLADSIHSATDILNSVISIIANKLASKKSDEKHPYGHGKIEYVFTLVISVLMIIFAFDIFKNSINSLLSKSIMTYSNFLIYVCLATIVIKIVLYFYAKKVANKYNNLLIMATAEDNRNDIFMTSTTLIGIILSKYNIYFVDSMVGIGISLWIFYISFKLFICAYNVLIDTDLDSSRKQAIIEKIEDTNISKIKSIIARPIGVDYMVLIKLKVPEELSIKNTDALINKIKGKVKKTENISEVIVELETKD